MLSACSVSAVPLHDYQAHIKEHTGSIFCGIEEGAFTKLSMKMGVHVSTGAPGMAYGQFILFFKNESEPTLLIDTLANLKLLLRVILQTIWELSYLVQL